MDPKVYDHIIYHHVLVLLLQLQIHSGQHETSDVHGVILMLPESIPFSSGGILRWRKWKRILQDI